MRSRIWLGLTTAFLMTWGSAGCIKRQSKSGASAPPGKAYLQQQGDLAPLHPQNGFPMWYRDGSGNKLEACLDPADTRCLPMPDGVDTTQPIMFPDNFPDEFFYWTGEADLETPLGSFQLVMAHEAAFANEVPIPGTRMVFGRIRIRSGSLPIGKYRVTHPFGVDVFDVTEVAAKSINYTHDVGIVAEDFSSNSNSPIKNFLKWDPTIAPEAPAGYIGDPNILHEVVGSPYGTDYLRVEMQQSSGWVQLGQTDKFSISGKQAVFKVLSDRPGDTYARLPKVKLVSSEHTAEIFYTTDGSDPKKTETSKLYTDVLDLAEMFPTQPALTPIVLQFAARNGEDWTAVVSQSYQHDPNMMEIAISPPEGVFSSSPLSITLDPIGPVAKIFYTVDGSDPLDSATAQTYAGPFQLVGNGIHVVRYAAHNAAGEASRKQRSFMSIQENKLTNGPINNENGFPFWYKDKNNLSLELCLDPNDPKCLPPPANVDPTKPIVFPSNFPEEGFYWAASASATAPGNINAELVMAIEQAFLNEVPKADDRVVFARIRVRADNLDPGLYRVIHPYGVLNFTVTVKDKRNINFTDDFGFIPNQFDAATTGSIGPFLVWDETLPAAPEGYIGDPNVLHTVKGSPFNQNFFKIEKVGAETSTVLMTDQFSISGKKAVLRVSAGPNPGSYQVMPKVTLSASSPEAQIRYTTDGSDPSSGVVYTEAIQLSGSDVSVRAIAKLGDEVSAPISVNFRQDNSTPEVTAFPPEGAYPSTQVVTLTASEAGSRIFYTLDGTDPKNPFYHLEYTQPFMLVAPTTRILKYYAIDSAGNESPVMTGTYTFNLPDSPDVGMPMPALVASLDSSVVNDESLLNISWQAKGGASFNVQQSVNGGPFQNVNLFLQTSTSLPLSLANGSRYQFRVQSIDGNWSSSTYALGEEFTLNSFQESDDEVVYAGRWQGRNLADAFGRKTNYSSSANATATFSFTGRMISLIGVARPSGGLAEIFIDGVKVDTVDFYADSVKAARSLYVNNSLQPGSHTIQIRVVGQRNPLSIGNVVELDGFMTLR